MPTRLVVLLQSRKSAAAGPPARATAPTASVPPKRALVRRRAGRELIMVRPPFIVRRAFIVPRKAIPKRAVPRGGPQEGGFHARPYELSTWGTVNMCGQHWQSTCTVNYNSAKIVHVGMGCTRSQKVIDASEEFGRIVVGKKSGGIEA